MNPHKKTFPTFEQLSDDEDDDDCVLLAEPGEDDKPFPPVMVDLFYLLADHYFKNSEFQQASEFYLMDVSWNPNRFDAWVSLTL